jgi:hypothetical protein
VSPISLSVPAPTAVFCHPVVFLCNANCHKEVFQIQVVLNLPACDHIAVLLEPIEFELSVKYHTPVLLDPVVLPARELTHWALLKLPVVFHTRA